MGEPLWRSLACLAIVVAVELALFVAWLRFRKRPWFVPFEPIEPADPRITRGVQAFLGIVANTLSRAGFTTQAYAAKPGPPSVRTGSYAVMLEHEPTLTRAVAVAVIQKRVLMYLLSYGVVLATRLASGRTVETANCYPLLPDCDESSTIRYFPDMQDLTLLHRVHLAAVARETDSVVPYASDSDPIQCLNADTIRAIKLQKRLRRVDERHGAFTTIGAVCQILENLPVVVQLRRRRAVRRAQQMLRELGFSPYYRMTKQTFTEF